MSHFYFVFSNEFERRTQLFSFARGSNGVNSFHFTHDELLTQELSSELLILLT